MRRAFTLPISLVYTLILAVILLPLTGKAVTLILTKQAERLDSLTSSITQRTLLQPDDTGSISQIHIPRIHTRVTNTLLTIRAWTRERVLTQPIIIQTTPPTTAWLVTIPMSIPYQTGVLSGILSKPLPLRVGTDPVSRSLSERLTMVPQLPTGDAIFTFQRTRPEGVISTTEPSERVWWLEPIKKNTPFALLHTPDTIVLPSLTPGSIMAARTDSKHAAVAISLTLRDALLTTLTLKKKAETIPEDPQFPSRCDGRYNTIHTLLDQNAQALTALRKDLNAYLTQNTLLDETALRGNLTVLADNYPRILAENEKLMRASCPTII